MRRRDSSRIAKSFGDAKRFLGDMLRFRQFGGPEIMELQAAEGRESAYLVAELLAEFRRARIGPPHLAVGEIPGRGQCRTKSHQKVQLPLVPLARTRQRRNQFQTFVELIDRLDIRGLLRAGFPGLEPIGDCLSRAIRLRVVMRQHLRLRVHHIGKPLLQQLRHLKVILLAGALQQRLIRRVLD